MYNKWGKPNQNSHKYKHTHHEYDPTTPTFSSSILHQPNNSHKPHLRKIEQKHDLSGAFREEKMSTLRRACLVEKWVEKKVNSKVIARGRNPPTPSKRTLLEEFDLQDALFFTSSKTEYSVFLHPKPSHGSAPPSPRPKPVRTRVIEPRFADEPGLDHRTNKVESFEKNRSRAHKIYSNLKNLKQPISPGARLSSFITSIFAKEGKRTKNRKECKSELVSNCSSSASPFSKSCLSRTSSPTSSLSSSSKKKFPDRVKRTVRFCPSVNLILDDDKHDQHRRLRRTGGVERESDQKVQKQRQLEEAALDLLNGYWDAKLHNKSHNQNANRDYRVNHGINYGQDEEVEDNDEEDDDDDRLSCSSSDLFELDNLALIGDELPVYETAQFDPKIM